METLLKLPSDATPSTISEVLASLRKEHFEPRHEAKAWGDWIYLQSYTTVISIESNNGLSTSATIEHGENEETGEPTTSIYRAFDRLGWHGVDADGEFSLS
jgi:PKD repeat protein